jgi:alpha-tubulin suppressor-like RCC1 family protein
VYGWGGNSYSQVGLASSSSVQVPTLVGGNLSGKNVTKIACGGNHTLALTASGEASIDTVWAFHFPRVFFVECLVLSNVVHFPFGACSP